MTTAYAAAQVLAWRDVPGPDPSAAAALLVGETFLIAGGVWALLVVLWIALTRASPNRQ